MTTTIGTVRVASPFRRLIVWTGPTVLAALSFALCLHGTSRSMATVPDSKSTTHFDTRPAHSKSRLIFHTSAGQQSIPKQRAELEKLVLKSCPHRGKRYADYMADLMLRTAAREHFPVEAVAVTAYIESDFNMSSGPCLGVMQINPSTYREVHQGSGLNPRRLPDNVRLGTQELRRHYMTSRHMTSDRERLAYMWGRYNGCGSHGSYVRKALRMYRTLRHSEGLAA